MHPRLFEISGQIPGGASFYLPAYFTMVAIGFVLATLLAYRWAARQQMTPGLMIDLGLWMAIWGVIGSRILHIFADGFFWDYVHLCTDPSLVDWKVDLRECKQLKGSWDAVKSVCHPVERNCFAWADLSGGGFAFYGGFVAATIYGFRFIRHHQLPVGKIVDMAGWGIMLGLAWGRMGCFLSSCCFGSVTQGPLGVVFPSSSAVSHHHWQEGLLSSYRLPSLAVHPTQLYESLGALAIAAFAYFWLRPRKRYDGQVFMVATVLYAVLRFAVEFWRRDARGGVLGLSTSQWVAIGAIAFAVALGRRLKARSVRVGGR